MEQYTFNPETMYQPEPPVVESFAHCGLRSNQDLSLIHNRR